MKPFLLTLISQKLCKQKQICLLSYIRYRRAKAITSETCPGVNAYKTALTDLKKAYSLSPADCSIRKAIALIQQELDKRKENKEFFKGIFCEKKDIYVDNTL